MLSLIRALSAEILKTKRTLFLALAFLAPLALAFIEMAIGFQYGKRMYPTGGDSWATLIDHITVMWVLLMLPLFVTLEMGLLGALEHNNKTWKQLYALPIPRWSLYAAKQITGGGIVALSMFALALMTAGVGLFARFCLPDLGFAAPIPWAMLFKNMLFSFLAAGMIIAIHLFISLRLSSFVVAMGVGIIATVLGVVVVGSEWQQFDPWVIPWVVSSGLMYDEPYTLALAIGLGGGIIVAVLGCLNTIRRDVL